MDPPTRRRLFSKHGDNVLTKNEILALANDFEPPVVTITLPTHRRGPEVAQDRIRLKNLLQNARDTLESDSDGSVDISAVLQPAEKLLDDEEFWQHQDRGLALFLNADRAEIRHVPVRLDECAVVGEFITLAPFADLLVDESDYLLLAAAYDDVRFFRGNRFNLQALHTNDIPDDMQKLLGLTEIEGAVHSHPSGPTPTTHGEATPKHHSLGPSAQDEHKDLKDQFAGDLARSVDKYLAKRNYPPLVLIADDALLGAYRAAAKQEPLANKDTRVSPASLDEDDLHTLAWPLVEEACDDDAAILDRFAAHWQDSASDKALVDADKIVEAAEHGRIETLLVARHETNRGAFAVDEGTMDALNKAIRLTLNAGGQLHVVADGLLPAGSSISAILRF